MKKNTLGKILIAALAALVLCIGLMACDSTSSGDSGEGGGDATASEGGSSDGADPLMDGEDEGKWNYTAQYVMSGVYGDEPQTDVALMLMCADGKFTVSSPKGIPSEIVPFSDEWNELVNGADGIEGTYTYEYDGDVAKVTFTLNGQTETVEIADDGFEQTFEIPATFFDPDNTTSYIDEVNGEEIPHDQLTLKFLKY